ncbi:MAG: 5-deoxy-glucuronate isomerase [Pedococcus sp.]
MNHKERWVLPVGSAVRDGWDVVVDAATEDWQHTGLLVASLTDGQTREVAAGGWEHVVVPLSGSVLVESDGDRAHLAGRPSVFAGPTDVAYAASGRGLAVTATGGPAKVAVCAARAAEPHTRSFRHLSAGEVPVELRGAGAASREVRNFAIPGVLDADSIIACEVVTPAGNWSSYPPHKHDEERAGIESQLEEIYYFEVQVESGRPAPDDVDPVGYQRVYGTELRPIDVLAEVRSGDVVLVPHGWHGPSMAAPGYDLYYLNVMAGPGPDRAWLICDDPAHTWVRSIWDDQAIDSRLPFGGTR